jgi:hypothetical protein
MRNKEYSILLFAGILAILVAGGVNADSPEYVNDWVYEGAGTATCVAVSSDENYIAVGTPDGLYLLDGEGNFLWDYQTEHPIVDISMTADASYIVAGGSSGYYVGGAAYFFNRMGEFEGTVTASTGISSVSFSPEGSYFAMTYDNGLGWNDRVALAGEGQWLWYHDFGRSGTAAVSISAEAAYVAVGGAAPVFFWEKGGVVFFDKTGDGLWGHAIDTTALSGDKYSVSISVDGKYVVAGNRGNDNLYFFDRDQGFLWSYNTGPVEGVGISGDGNYVVAASNSKVCVFDRYKNPLWESQINDIEDVAISADANTIVVSTDEGEVYKFRRVDNYSPTNLCQLKSDGQTEIPVGGCTDEGTVVFRADVNDPDGDRVKLQIELRQLDEYEGKFLNEFTKESDFVTSGSEATVTVYGLIDGNYHWQARAVDEKGLASEWVEFGNNDILEVDFAIVVTVLFQKVVERPLVSTLIYPSPYVRATVSYRPVDDITYEVLKVHFSSQGVRHARVAFYIYPHELFFPYLPILPPLAKWGGSYWDDGDAWAVLPDVIVHRDDVMYLMVGGVAEGTVHFGTSPAEALLGLAVDLIRNAFPVYTTFEPETPLSEATSQGMTFELALLGSPAELRVYDPEERVTGFIDGQPKEEIPNSMIINESIVIFLPSASYKYEVVGIGDGTYKLGVASVANSEMTTFEATDIPASPNAVHQYTTDWEALSQGGAGVTLLIDAEGDGLFERTIISDNKLTPCEIAIEPVGYELISQKKISETESEYIFRLVGKNTGKQDVKNITLKLASEPNGTSVIDGVVYFSVIEGGEQLLSDDTFTVRSGKSQDVLESELIWQVCKCVERPKSDFSHDWTVSLADLAKFADQWLNSCSEPNWCQGTDLDQSNLVNFIDFATFAQNWLWEIIPADFNIDGEVEFTDYAVFANQWMAGNCAESAWCDEADFNKSGSVDLFDLAEFAEQWLEGSK